MTTMRAVMLTKPGEAQGDGVTTLKQGDRVCALLVHGGYATHVIRGAEHWVKVPEGLDAAEAVSLILNSVTALQMIEREAKLQPGQSALVNAANGGVGQALLDLLRARGVNVIGAASARKHELVRSYGATPIEGRTAPLDVSVRALRPEGVDAAFDGVGGAQTGQCVRATRRGGGSFYGITMLYRKNPQPFRDDLATLCGLLAAKKISPRIAERLPLLDARKANERLEAGNIEGKLVLVAS